MPHDPYPTVELSESSRSTRRRMLSGMWRMPSRRLLGIQSIGPSGVKVSIRASNSWKASASPCREAGAKADVGTEAEGHVAVRRARDVEAEGIVEDGRIAIGRHLPVGDLVAALMRWPLKSRRASPCAACRSRAWSSAGSRRGRCASARYRPCADARAARDAHQRPQAAADGAARRLGTGRKQQHEEIEQLIVGERPALAAILPRLEPRLDDRRQNIVGQICALLGDQAAP